MSAGQLSSATPSPTIDPSVAAAVAQAEASASAAAAQASIEAALPPDPKDFQINIRVTKQDCYGSAGCNITYQIDPHYTGPKDLKQWEVTYEVDGGDSPKVNTFTIDASGTASFDKSEFVQTDSSTPHLTGKVTSVHKTD